MSLVSVSEAYLEVRDKVAEAIESALPDSLGVYKSYTVASSLSVDSAFPALWVNVSNLARVEDERTTRTNLYDINLTIVSAFDEGSLIGGERIALMNLMKAYDVIFSALTSEIAYVKDVSVSDINPNVLEDDEGYVFANLNCVVRVVVK